jgi:hypothetical protein
VLPKKPKLAAENGFSLNDRVRVRTGALRGFFGLYAGQAPRDRIRILMEMLGGQQEIEMPAGSVIRI